VTTVIAPPPPQSQPSPSHGRELIGRAGQGLRAAFRGTPGRLRVIALVIIAGCLIAGFGSALAVQARTADLAQARSTLQHLVQLEKVETSLLEADAAITNSFLQGGLENAAQLKIYYSAMDLASGQLAVAARASDSDAAELGAANVDLARYAGLIEAARSTNRQGLPVGANYLKDATASLSTSVIARLDGLARADRTRIDAALDRADGAQQTLILSSVLGLALVAGAQYALAQRTKRILNPPAVAATVALTLLLGMAATAMAAVQRTADQTRESAYADTVNLTAARVAAFRAKSIESLGLISRGSGGGETEDLWQAQLTAAADLRQTAGDAAERLSAYQQAHQDIRELDDGGNWDGAVKLAVATGDGTANDAFSAYTAATGTALAQRSQAASDGLHTSSLLPLIAVLLMLTGVGTAIVGWFGVSLRMGEYR
jgi:hypothetical protein